MSDPLVIDCDTCSMKATKACDDCVVTFVCSRDPARAVVIDVPEATTVRMLMRAGLVPRSRHVPAGPEGSARTG